MLRRLTSLSFAFVALGILAGCEKKEQSADKSEAVQANAPDASPRLVENPHAIPADDTPRLVFALPNAANKLTDEEVAAEMSKAAGVPVEIKRYEGLAPTISQLRKGHANVSVLEAWPYLVGHHKADLTVVAAEVRDGKTAFEACWFVRADDKGLKELNDLKEKRIAFASKRSGPGFLYATAALLESEVIGPDDDPREVFSDVRFATSEDEVMKQLVGKEVDGVAASEFAPETLPEADRTKVKRLACNGPVPTRAIAIKSTESPELREAALNAALALNAIEEKSTMTFGAGKWEKREHYQHADTLQQMAEATQAEYPLPGQ